MHTNQVVYKSHVSPMPFDGRHLGVDDKCLDIMLPAVAGMVASPCSGENRSIDLLSLAAFHSRLNFSLAYRIVTLTYSLGPLSRFDEMNADHMNLLGYEVVLLRLAANTTVL